MPTVVPPTPFESKAAAMRFGVEQELMPWEEVAAAWNAMSGESIQHTRAWQIARGAEAELARELADLAGEL